MVALFSPDSPLMRGLTRFADVMILNLVFIGTALPLVTLGPALTALNFTAMRIGSGECNTVLGDYFRSFRRNFRQATLIGLLLGVVATAIWAWFMVIDGLPLSGEWRFGLLILWYVLAFGFATTSAFVFPYLAQFEGSTREVLRNARLLSWKHPLTALVALALPLLAGGATLLAPAATGYGLFWLLFGFAGIALASGFLFSRIFRRLIAAQGAA